MTMNKEVRVVIRVTPRSSPQKNEWRVCVGAIAEAWAFINFSSPVLHLSWLMHFAENLHSF